MDKTTLFSRAGRLAVAVSGALALAGAALPANASTLRIAMTAADIPLTLGQPDQGYEGNRFTGIPLYDLSLIHISEPTRLQLIGAGDRVAHRS
ncbi:hypothetical protein ACL655_05995 [Klebsiella quasipneumoniae subsp. similipneumoniae]